MTAPWPLASRHRPLFDTQGVSPERARRARKVCTAKESCAVAMTSRRPPPRLLQHTGPIADDRDLVKVALVVVCHLTLCWGC